MYENSPKFRRVAAADRRRYVDQETGDYPRTYDAAVRKVTRLWLGLHEVAAERQSARDVWGVLGFCFRVLEAEQRWERRQPL